MTQMATKTAHRPAWVDLSSGDAAASREFYSKLFGWKIDVNPDPKYGGYGRATVQGRDAAGITPTQTKEQPTAWNFYIHTDDVDSRLEKVEAAGGKIAMPPMDIPDQGRMAVFQDPAGAYISVWQPTRMGGFEIQGPNTFGWAELNARGIEKVLPFYEEGLRLDHEALACPRWHGLHRVPGRWDQRRRCDRDEPDGRAFGAEPLARVLRRRRRPCDEQEGRRAGRSRDHGAAELPGRRLCDPRGSAGRLVRAVQVDLDPALNRAEAHSRRAS